MFNRFMEILSYSFIYRALIVGVLVSLCASLLGVSLVLKRYSMIGDGLSHVSFGALSIALALNIAPLKVSIPVVVLAAFGLLRIRSSSKMKSDAVIAVISSSALAVGIIATSVTTGMNTDVGSYMFGSILAMSREDVTLSIVLSIILTAITIVLGMRMMGAMLISSLIIFPSLISMRVFGSFRGVMISAGILSVVDFLIGMFLSYEFDTPVGASIVIVNLVMLGVFACVGRAADAARRGRS